MNRWVLRAAVFALIGFVVNAVVVAVVAATVDPYRKGVLSGMGAFPGAEASSATPFALSRLSRDFGVTGFWIQGQQAGGPLQITPGDMLPEWIPVLRGTNTPDGTMVQEEAWVAVGFPRRCVFGFAGGEARSGAQVLKTYRVRWGLSGGEPAWKSPSGAAVVKNIIPYRPIFDGLLVNTAFYSVLTGSCAAGCLVLRSLVRGRRRFRRGHCPDCGYDRGGDFRNPCPECGFALIGLQESSHSSVMDHSPEA